MKQMLFEWKNIPSWEPLIRSFKLKKYKRSDVSFLFEKHYNGILVYHGCRPLDVSEYYKNGLRRGNYQTLDQQARTIFISDEFREITQAAFQDAIEKLSGIDDYHSCVALDDRKLLDSGGHYLIYGSERILKIASSLTRYGGRDYMEVLKRFGRPTVLSLKLSTMEIGQSDLDQFYDVIFSNIKQACKCRTMPLIDFTFSLSRDLAPASTLEHYHPTKILDPIRNRIPYIYMDNT